MAEIFKKHLNQNAFSNLLTISKNTGAAQLSDFSINGIEIPAIEVANVHFTDVTWENIDARGRKFSGVVFENCTLKNVNFSNTTQHDTRFKNCTLENVVMDRSSINQMTFENCKIQGANNSLQSFRELDAGTINFLGTKIENVNFIKSKGNFVFESSKLNDVQGYGLKKGSSITVSSSELAYFDFSGSILDSLIVTNSSIAGSKILSATIGSVVLDNNRNRQFPLAGGKFRMVSANKMGNVVVGDSVADEIEIKDCGNTSFIHVGNMISFNKITINGCDPTKLIFYNTTGDVLSVTNMTASIFDLEDANIKHLILRNVTIEKKILATNAKVVRYEAHNVRVLDGVKIEDEGSNFKIESTK